MLCFLISALLVKNPVYALLSLVGVVINMAMILIYMMADFLGFLLIVWSLIMSSKVQVY
jgi:NADH:ubiquinone oxidoreductase subunit 6 (subunit J)